jgi:hypothetical protein
VSIGNDVWIGEEGVVILMGNNWDGVLLPLEQL